MILVAVMILVDFGNAFWLFAVMKERKHRLVAVMILVVLEYGFRLILFDYFIR